LRTLAVDEDAKRRRHIQSAVDQADLEFDLQEPSHAPHPDADEASTDQHELEVDPFGEFEIPASLAPPAPHVSVAPPARSGSLPPGVIAELSLDFDDEVSEAPAVSAPKPAVSAPKPAVSAPSVSAPKPMVSAPNPAEASLTKAALRAPAVPDLEIPSLSVAAARPPVKSAASVRSSVPAGPGPLDSDFSLEVDYGSHPQGSSLPPSAFSQPGDPKTERSQRQSLVPSAVGKPSPLPKVLSGQRSSVPPRDLGRVADDWSLGLDDLGGLGSARSAQLDVAVQLPKSDGVPWPVGRTPFADDLEVNSDAVARAGFGPPPQAWWGTPSYAWRVMRKQPALSKEVLEAQAALRRCEATRDQKLGVLAESKRKEIAKQERFSSLYAQVDESAVALKAKAQELESLNQQGAAELRMAEQKLSSLHTRYSHVESEREAARQRVEEQNTQLMRQSAALKRLQIEARNLTTRFDNDAIPEAQYRLHAADLAHKTDLVEQEIAERQKQLLRLKGELNEADQQLRLAASELQRQEGVIEAHLITLEGSGAEKTRSLAELRATHAQLISGIGAAIVELRGHVPVDEGTRADLLVLDAQVKDAAVFHRTLLLAQSGVDGAALRLGRGLWVTLVVVVVVLVLRWLAA